MKQLFVFLWLAAPVTAHSCLILAPLEISGKQIRQPVENRCTSAVAALALEFAGAEGESRGSHDDYTNSFVNRRFEPNVVTTAPGRRWIYSAFSNSGMPTPRWKPEIAAVIFEDGKSYGNREMIQRIRESWFAQRDASREIERILTQTQWAPESIAFPPKLEDIPQIQNDTTVLPGDWKEQSSGYKVQFRAQMQMFLQGIQPDRFDAEKRQNHAKLAAEKVVVLQRILDRLTP